MHKPFDFLVFIGRFQPFHQGHLAVLDAALEQAQRVIVLLGSAFQPRTFRNPWYWQEREQMLRACLPDEMQARVIVVPLQDAPYQQARWIRNVQMVVQQTVQQQVSHDQPVRIGLIGHRLNQAGYYPRWFPQWDVLGVAHREGVNGTDIRQRYLAPDQNQSASPHQDASPSQDASQNPNSPTSLPAPVHEWLLSFARRDDYTELQTELAFIENYKRNWASAPYDVNFVTVDAVVVQSGHILLVERKGRPGKGLLALPGGFLDTHECIRDACLRELEEETHFPLALLQSAIRGGEVFDAPYRSARGRTITHAFYFELAPDVVLPAVEAGDDARTAQWVPLAELDPARMFEDHYFIVQKMVGL